MSIDYTVDEVLCKYITRKRSNIFGFLCKKLKKLNYLEKWFIFTVINFFFLLLKQIVIQVLMLLHQ